MPRLFELIRSTSQKATRSGHLVSLPTQLYHVEDGPFRFVVRVLGNIEKKKDDGKKRGPDFNPFLPYDEEMFVAKAPPRHTFLLNKFNVVDDHLLIVTDSFEEQSSLLNKHDFAAMWMVLADYDGLAFYNAGRVAGASQKHKHLQVIPTPVDPEGDTRMPFEVVFNDALKSGGDSGGDVKPVSSAQLPFVHALVQLSDCVPSQTEDTAEKTFARYIDCLNSISRELPVEVDAAGASGAPSAYNLIATRDWMLIVPRSQECYEGVSVNSLGFAGAVLVPREELMDHVRKVGPMAILRAVSFERR
eukprot:Plantae.Rhodophyta-Purpureofilum_apyrenoidigerum.ctg21872.p2 GENE.Plantae.Rhodophyta-Purpureofilum_apyrenoidigerum.ctg21872~~Plantae.Rhodophyta-Purpureofilum_apyrenoidigerum.ctg21872.p2  ORF type:complete len:303 (-),score=53.79 Plantae.Rhodophyta-Purpureofilum_apyrenoidigerum.ctg21872:991-1899(-)